MKHISSILLALAGLALPVQAARTFDGVDDRIAWGDLDAFDNIQKMTVSFWLSPSATTPDWGVYLSKASGETSGLIIRRLDDAYGNAIDFGVCNGNSDHLGRLNISAWDTNRHYVLVFDGTATDGTTPATCDRLKLYINGSAVAFDDGFWYGIPASFPANSGELIAGHGSFGEAAYGKGTMSELAIWYGTALTASQVSALYTAKGNPLGLGPVPGFYSRMIDQPTNLTAPTPATTTGTEKAPHWGTITAEAGDTPSRVYYVATTGNDTTGDGTSGAPYATLTKARDVIRTATGRTSDGTSSITISDGGPAWDGAWVVLASGIYPQTATIQLDERDSGTSTNPIVYLGASGADARIVGSAAVDNADWVEVTSSSDSWAYNLIPVAARGSVYRLLMSEVTTNEGTLGGTLNDKMDELFLVVNGERKKMSRWPVVADENDSSAWITVSAVDNTSGSESVTIDSDGCAGFDFSGQSIFAQGAFAIYNYYMIMEAVSSGTDNGSTATLDVGRAWAGLGDLTASNGSDKRYLRLRNGLEFITSDSYVWDPNGGSTGVLYYYSPSGAPMETRIALVQDLIETNPMVGGDYEAYNTSAGAKYIEFHNLTLADARRRVIFGGYPTNFKFLDCTIANAGIMLADFCYASGLEYHDTTLRDSGVYAARLHGGDLLTYTAGNLVMDGCTIDDIGDSLVSDIAAAVDLTRKQILPYSQNAGHDRMGSGVTITSSSFTNFRDTGIGVGASNVLIQGNTFDGGCRYLADNGAISSAANWLILNVRVLGNNFENIRRNVHSLGSTPAWAIYCDSLAWWSIHDNTANTCEAFGQIGGLNISVRRNKMTNCHSNHYAAPIVHPINVFGSPKNYHVAIKEGLDQVNWSTAPWNTTYAALGDYRTGGAKEAVTAYTQNMVVLDNATTTGSYLTNILSSEQETTVGGFPVFCDMDQLNYALGANPSPPADSGGATALSSINKDT